MKINNFRGSLSDISAKTATLNATAFTTVPGGADIICGQDSVQFTDAQPSATFYLNGTLPFAVVKL